MKKNLFLCVVAIVLAFSAFIACGGVSSYTISFVADGEVVSSTTFSIDDTSVTTPSVPTKYGYTGAWEDYTLGEEDITVNAVYTVDSAFTQVSTADELTAELAKQTDKILVTDDITLSLASPLYIDYGVTLASADDVTVSVERASDFVGSNDNIVVTGDDATIANIDFDFTSISTGYGIVVGMGGGKYPAISDETIVDGFTLSNVTMNTATSLSALYFGDSHFTGEFLVEDCTFNGGATAIASGYLVDCTFTFTDNTYSNTEDKLLNYFFIYSPTAATNLEGSKIENVTVNFTDNTLSGKVANGTTWLANGVENHLYANDEVTFASSGNTMTVTAEEKATIDALDADSTHYVLSGIEYIVA